MYIFQSEQVIKLRFWFKNNLADIYVQRSQSNGLSCWVQWDAIYAKSKQHWRQPYYRYGMICHTNSLLRQSCHFETDFNSVLLQLADTLNTQF